MKEIEIVKMFEARIEELKRKISRMKTLEKWGGNRLLRERILFTQKTLELSERLLSTFKIGVVHV